MGTESIETSQHILVKFFSETMSSLRPTMTSNHNTKRKTYEDKQLKTSKFVFIRVDAVKTPLQSSYTGPHLVVRSGPKTFRLDINGQHREISIYRLKVAYMENASTPAQLPQLASRDGTTEDASETLPSLTGLPKKTTQCGGSGASNSRPGNSEGRVLNIYSAFLFIITCNFVT